MKFYLETPEDYLRLATGGVLFGLLCGFIGIVIMLCLWIIGFCAFKVFDFIAYLIGA